MKYKNTFWILAVIAAFFIGLSLATPDAAAAGRRPYIPPCATATPAPAYRDVVLATQLDNIIAYYEFNGDGGDSGPLNLPGSWAYNVAYEAGGVDGTQAARFDPTLYSSFDPGQWFSLEIDNRWSQDLTVVAWVKAIDTAVWDSPPQTNLFSVFSSDNDAVSFFTDGAAGLGYAVSFDGSGGLYEHTPITGADWHMLAITRAGTAVTIYVDGAPVDTEATSSLWTGVVIQAIAGGGGTSWNGWIDEITVWDAGLSPAQIGQLYLIGNQT